MSQNSPKQWFQLEELFFQQVDQKLMDDLRGEMNTAETAEAIMQVTGINNEHLAKEMAELNVTIDTLAAFRLAPLVAVAWADDRVEENERFRIVKAAEQSGIKPEDPAMALLKNWTERRPGPELLDTWCEYAQALSASLEETHRATLAKEVLEQVNSVAEAAGGLLGFGSVSPSEKKTIDRIAAALQ